MPISKQPKDKAAEQARLAADVEAFLKKGGKVEEASPGESAETPAHRRKHGGNSGHYPNVSNSELR